MLFQPKRRSQSWLRKPPRRCLFQLSQFVVLEVDSSRQNRRLQLSRSALMESPNPNSQNPNEIESYVMVHNIAKRHNVGTLARSATAFGVSELILVGRRDFNAFGNHGSTAHLRFRHFHSLQEARFFLKGRDCDICGVEITDDAVAVSQHPFKKSTAFLLGNEGMGLSAKECEICDFFVYIPQYGCGTASLNVTVAASIVLHHFGVWAGFSERTRDGNKFVVAEKPVKQARRNYCAETAESITEKRKSKKENASNGFFDENGSANSSSNLLDALFDGLET